MKAAPNLTLANIKAPKNGYCFVYVSNESDEMVYFDNLQVTQNHARIIEENHYYSYGLKIAAISSKKLGDINEGSLKNNYLYNDKELWDEADLNWYDYGFRNYDPQIGRFPQLDPLTDDYPELTPYQYASCEPIANIDIDGLEAGSAISYSYDIAKSASPFTFIAPKVATAATGVNIFKLGTSVIPAVSSGLNLLGNKAVSDGISNGLSKPIQTFSKSNKPIARTSDLLTNSRPGDDLLNNPDDIGAKMMYELFTHAKQTKAAYEQGDVGNAVIYGVNTIIDATTLSGGGPGFVTKGNFDVKIGPAKNGSTPSNKLGQDMHKEYKVLEHNPSKGMYKEYTGLKAKYGIKPDFVDFNTKTIFDLKPNNPAKAKEHLKQVENYKAIFEEVYGGTWNIVIDHY